MNIRSSIQDSKLSSLFSSAAPLHQLLGLSHMQMDRSWSHIESIEDIPLHLQGTYLKNRLRALKIYGDYIIEFWYYKAIRKEEQGMWTYTNSMAPNLRITTSMSLTDDPMSEYEFRGWIAASYNYKIIL